MIVFDLRCAGGHVFEAWFGSGAAYDDQRARGLVSCPICGTTEVDKAAMAPAVAPKGNARSAPGAAEAKRALDALAAAQADALSRSTWVGGSFVQRARAMHEGVEPHAAIHGQATREEAKSLVEDGVPIAPLPLPVVPPERRN